MISPLFTSLERLRAAVNAASSSFDAELLSCGMAASMLMQGNMSRGIRVESRTETYRVSPSGIVFLKASPILSVTSVTVQDSQGASRPLSFFFCDTNELHITEYVDPKAPVAVIYIGGLAPARLRFHVTVESVIGTPSIGAITGPGITGGKIVSWSESAATAIIETDSGVVDQEAVITGVGFSFVVVDAAQEVNLSASRDLQKACEQQAAYMYQRRNSLGRTASTMGGTTTFEKDYDLLPGVARVCNIYSPPMQF